MDPSRESVQALHPALGGEFVPRAAVESIACESLNRSVLRNLRECDVIIGVWGAALRQVRLGESQRAVHVCDRRTSAMPHKGSRGSSFGEPSGSPANLEAVGEPRSMSKDIATDLRQRIYQSYVSARKTRLAPPTLAGLKPRMPYLGRIIRRHFPQDRSIVVLDLGCGHGAFAHALHKAGYQNVRGVDASSEQVAEATRLGIEGVQEGDVMQILEETEPASVDVALSFDLIEHFAKTELIQLVDSVHRVLRPGGYWIVHVPNGESPFGNRMRYGDLTHELAFTRTSIAQLLLSSGFSKVSCHEDRPAVHGVKSGLRAGLWFLIRVTLLLYIAIETGCFDRDAVFSQNLLAVTVKSV